MSRETNPFACRASSVFRLRSQSACSRFASLTMCRVTRVIIGSPGARRSALQPHLVEVRDRVLRVDEPLDLRMEPLEVRAVVPRHVGRVLVHEVRDLAEGGAALRLVL